MRRARGAEVSSSAGYRRADRGVIQPLHGRKRSQARVDVHAAHVGHAGSRALARCWQRRGCRSRARPGGSRVWSRSAWQQCSRRRARCMRSAGAPRASSRAWAPLMRRRPGSRAHVARSHASSKRRSPPSNLAIRHLIHRARKTCSRPAATSCVSRSRPRPSRRFARWCRPFGAAGGLLDDDGLLLALARQTLGSPGELVGGPPATANVSACSRRLRLEKPNRQWQRTPRPVRPRPRPTWAAPIRRATCQTSCRSRPRPPQPPRAPLQSTHFVDVHHLRPRSEGARTPSKTSSRSARPITVHGELRIETGAEGLSYRHAEGTPYGEPVTASFIDADAKVFSALRHLGFRDREARARRAARRPHAA
jgi:hypothetical protein